MTLEDDSEEEFLDDPIILIDFEQERIARNSIEEANGTVSEKIEVYIDLTDSDVEVSDGKSSSATNNSTTLPVTFFDIPENLKLLNECRPLCINVVDCEKHAWYYAKRIKSVENNSDIIVTDKDIDVCSIDIPKSESRKLEDRTGVVTPTTEMNMLNRSPGNKPKIRPVDVSLYIGHSKHGIIRSRMESEKKIEVKNDSIKLDMHSVTAIKKKRDNVKETHSGKETEVFKNRQVENQKAVEQKLRPIDFKKNQGLVGLIVTNMAQSNTKDNQKRSEIKCLNIQEKPVNITHAEANKKQSTVSQNSFSIGQISSPEKVLKLKQRKRRLGHAHGNITMRENDKMVELQSDPLRIKVVDRLTFENQKISTKHTKSKPKQNNNEIDTQNGKQDQYREGNISSSVDSAYVRKKKSQKNLTKHWKDTVRMFTKTKQALLNPKSGKTRIKNICADAKKIKIHEPEKIQNECKEKALSVNLNKNICIVNKKTDLAANTPKKSIDCNKPVEVYCKNPKYKDMPCLDEDEVINENDCSNSGSKFFNLSRNTINTKSVNDAKKLKMKVLPKDSSNNVKYVKMGNSKNNTANSQNNTSNTDNYQLNPGVKYTSKPIIPSSAGVSNGVFGGSNQTNSGISQTNTPAPTNQSQQVHDNEHNSTKQNIVIQKNIMNYEKSIKKHTSNIMNVRKSLQNSLLKLSATKSAVPQHSENQYCAIGLPDTACATDNNISNSDNQNVPSPKAEDDAATNLTVYVHAPRSPNIHSNKPCYPYQENFGGPISYASNMSTASENKIYASLKYGMEAQNIPNNKDKLSYTANEVNTQFQPNANIDNTLSNLIPIKEHGVMVNTSLHVNMGNTQPIKHAMVINTSSHVNMGYTQSNLKSMDGHAMTSNNSSQDNVCNTHPNISSIDKDAMMINNNMHVNFDNAQSHVNLMDEHAIMTNTGSHNNMGNNQPDVSNSNKHTMMSNNNVHVNLGNVQSNVHPMDKYAMMTIVGSHNISNNQPNVNSIDNKHKMMLKSDTHVTMDNAQSNVNHNQAIMTITGSHNIGSNQSNVNSIDNKHAMMLNANMHDNIGNGQSNASQLDKHALMTSTGSNIHMSNPQSIDNHAMILNNGSHNINKGYTQPIVSPSDKLAMTLNTLNRPIQNQVGNYNEPQGRPIDTVASNVGRYYPRPYYRNPPWKSGPVNKSVPRQQAVPQNNVCKPDYYNRSVNINFPANGLPCINIYNPYNADLYTQFRNSAYPLHPVPPPPQDFPSQKHPSHPQPPPPQEFSSQKHPPHPVPPPPQEISSQILPPHPVPPPPLDILSRILQQLPLPKPYEGSTVIGQNGTGLIRTINLKSLKSTELRNEGAPKSKHFNYPSDAQPVNSKSEMLEELTKELNNVPDVECSNRQNTETPHKVDAHHNLTNLLPEKKLGHFSPNIITRPTPGPLSRTSEVASSHAPQFPPYQNNTFENTDYSPPILPIPTYQQSLEMLTQMNMYRRARNPARINCLANRASLNEKTPDKKNAGNRKRKLPKSYDKQVKRKTKASEKFRINGEQMSLDEYKKKISLEEYKKRVSLNRESVIHAVKDFDEGKLEGAGKTTKDFDVKQNSDLDLGYDSDSTVKL